MGRTILPDPPAPPVTTPAATAVATPPPGAGVSPPAATEVASGAAATAEGAPPAEPAAVEPSKLERARAAAARATEDAKRHRLRQQQQADSQRQFAEMRAENERLKARAAFADEIEGLSKSDKIAAARRLGLSPMEVAQAALAEGKPEHAVERMRADLEKQFEAKYGSKLAEQQRFIEQMTTQQRQAAVVQAEEQFVKLAGDEAKYPIVSDMPPLMVLELGRKFMSDLPPEQRALVTYEDLLTFMERKYAEHRETRKKPTGEAVVPPVSSPKEAAGSTQSRTQANGAKGALGPIVTPEGFEGWSDRRQKNWMVAEIDKRRAVAKSPTAAK